MNLLTGHEDAFGVALILTAVFAMLVIVIIRAGDRHAEAARVTYRALRALDHKAYMRLWQQHKRTLATITGLDESAAQAEQLVADEPVPYLPVFTAGALPEDLDEEFAELMHAAFIAGKEAS